MVECWGRKVPNLKILCIEDNRQTQRMLTLLLAKAGFEVITADDGPQGIEKAKAWRPALILVDMMMPGMSGAEVIRRLRTDPVNRDVPMLILSAYEDAALIEEAQNAGADDYLLKTLSPIQLIRMIEDYLKVGQTMLTRRADLSHQREGHRAAARP
jgi:CheY-like chemotaxis protein